MEDDVARLQVLLGAPELLVDPAERRAPIAADEPRGIQPGTPVALLLHQREAHDRLRPGQEHPVLGEVELVVERDPAARHLPDFVAGRKPASTSIRPPSIW